MTTALATTTEDKGLSLIRQIMPKATKKFALRCQKAGMDNGEIENAIELVDRYEETTLPFIVKWRENGMSLDRIETCLEIRETCPGGTVKLINKYINKIDMVMTESVIGVFETLVEAANKFPGIFNQHFLLHRIEELMDGDIMTAYQIAIDDPEGLIKMLKRKRDILHVLCEDAFDGPESNDEEEEEV
jgi:hypothetical protein